MTAEEIVTKLVKPNRTADELTHGVKRYRRKRSVPCPLRPKSAQFSRAVAASFVAGIKGAEFGRKLYVYRCPGCKRWHLTKQEQTGARP